MKTMRSGEFCFYNTRFRHYFCQFISNKLKSLEPETSYLRSHIDFMLFFYPSSKLYDRSRYEIARFQSELE